MIDDSHATGILGETGRGTPQHLNVNIDVIILISYCSKLLQHNLVRVSNDCEKFLKLWIVSCELEPITKEAHKVAWANLFKQYRKKSYFAFPTDLEQKGLKI